MRIEKPRRMGYLGPAPLQSHVVDHLRGVNATGSERLSQCMIHYGCAELGVLPGNLEDDIFRIATIGLPTFQDHHILHDDVEYFVFYPCHKAHVEIGRLGRDDSFYDTMFHRSFGNVRDRLVDDVKDLPLIHKMNHPRAPGLILFVPEDEMIRVVDLNRNIVDLAFPSFTGFHKTDYTTGLSEKQA